MGYNKVHYLVMGYAWDGESFAKMVEEAQKDEFAIAAKDDFFAVEEEGKEYNAHEAWVLDHIEKKGLKKDDYSNTEFGDETVIISWGDHDHIVTGRIYWKANVVDHSDDISFHAIHQNHTEQIYNDVVDLFNGKYTIKTGMPKMEILLFTREG